MPMMLTACQTFAPIKVDAALLVPCAEINFVAGKFMPQVITLKTEYEICKVRNAALVAVLGG